MLQGQTGALIDGFGHCHYDNDSRCLINRALRDKRIGINILDLIGL